VRDIKFRGRNKNGWHYGLLTFMFGQYAIINQCDENNIQLIDKETIGQYTGSKDRNGREIYEGDVAAVEIIKGVKINVPVKFENGSFNIHEIPGGYGFRDTVYPLGALFLRDFGIEVIGNVYNNTDNALSKMVGDSNV